MYVYYIRDDTTGMYLIGRMKLGAPVPTCVWGEHQAEAMTFENATEARKAVAVIGVNAVSAYRLNYKTGDVIRLRSGGDGR